MRRLGPTGTAVLLRLSAFILLCIGVQIMWNGASALFRTLGNGSGCREFAGSAAMAAMRDPL